MVCRILLGLVFVFSGFVKTIDPWGTALKMGEYLAVWGLPTLPDGVLIGASIVMCAAELALGALLIFGVKKRLTSTLALALMVVFTTMTLLGATVLPVEDCGCFGDALPMTPWVSLGKNIVLLIFALALWADARVRKLALRPITAVEWVAMGVSFGLSVGLGLWCFLHLPPVDFLPFKRGVDLYEAKYVDESGDIALRQFAIFNSEGDGTHELLATSGRVYVLVARRLEDLSPRIRERFGAIAGKAQQSGERVILVTSSSIAAGQTTTFGGVPVEVYNLDQATMISMLRARFGVVELYGGTITGKQNWRDL